MRELSAGAKKILRHLHTNGFRQGVYETPQKLIDLFDNSEECENAEAELQDGDLIAVGHPPHFTVPHRVRAAALTIDGIRFIERGGLD